MSKNFAIVENGIVVNVIIADDEFVAMYQEQNPDQICVEYVESHINDENVARIGEHYIDGKFITPYVAPTVPQSITMRQARLILIQYGLDTTVENAINAITDDTQRKIAQTEWEYAATVDRHNGWIETLGASLGLTSDQLDQMFIEASQL